MITAETHGWEALRFVTFRRDGGCLATSRAIFGTGTAPDLCRDANGWIIPATALHKMEWDHVRPELGGERPNDEAHGVTICPWHHRLSPKWRSDSKLHRWALRQYLAKKYPDVWRDLLARSSLNQSTVNG